MATAANAGAPDKQIPSRTGNPSQDELLDQLKQAKQLEQDGSYEGAILIWQRLLKDIENIYGKSSTEAATALTQIAMLRVRQNRLDEAEPMLKRSLEITEKMLGKEHLAVATSLHNLAYLYKERDLYKKSELYYQRSMSIRRKINGPESLSVAESLNNLAGLRDAQSKYQEAEGLYLRSLRIREKHLGAEHPDVAISLNNLATNYQEQGRYKDAISLQRSALAIWEKTYNSDHPHISHALNNLAYLYKEQGLNQQAEALYQRSLKARQKNLGPEHPDVASSLINLGMLYDEQGRSDSAEKALVESTRILEKNFGPNHSRLATALNNLAHFYSKQNRPHEAEMLYKRSLAIREATLGRNHPDTAITSSNLAALYFQQRNYNKARPPMEHAHKVLTKNLGSGHPNLATAESNLAVIYDMLGLRSRAEGLFKSSLAITRRRGDNPIQTANLLGTIGGFYLNQDNCPGNLKALTEAAAQENNWLSRELPFLPPRLRGAQLATLDKTYKLTAASILRCRGADRALLGMKLNRQGLSSEVERQQELLIRSSDALKEKTRKAQSLIQQLSSSTSTHEQRRQLREVQDRLQAEIYRDLPDLQFKFVSGEKVATTLPTDGALVEFQRFQPWDGKQPPDKRWGDPRYVALILKSNGSITTVHLGAAKRIDNQIQKALAATATNASDTNEQLLYVSRLVLAPLRDELAGSRQWFLSPDGELNRVPFAALPSPLQPQQTLAETVQLRLLTTGRDLLRLQEAAKPGRSPVVMANPAFDRRGLTSPRIAASNTGEQPQSRSADLGAKTWAPLPASEQEGRQVAALLGTTAITGQKATTTALQQSRGPRVLHVATHGFFAADQERPPTDPLRLIQDTNPLLRGFQGEDPQLRSGLVLAGANQPDADPNDDGYLTAAEAVALQLDGTELVVLSACSTGQGEIRTGEGVYGLQRSLTVAGARSTLLSLWKVDDAATAEFMARFYKRLKNGEGRSDALAATQKEFREGIPGKPEIWKDTYYWGAWQLVGDWRPIQGL